jgi:hypothetical protein
VARLEVAPRGHGDEAVALHTTLDEDTPWRRSRAGSAWAEAVRALLEKAMDAVADQGGAVTDVGARGFSAWFPAHRTSAGINAAIEVHEWLQSHTADPHLEHVKVRSGLGYGRTFLYDTPRGWLMLGPAIERAQALAACAAEWAILADRMMLQDDTALDQIRSEAGVATRRHGADYIGPVMQLKEYDHRLPIAFHQVCWATHLFEPKADLPAQVSGGPRDRTRGWVERWDSARGHGFVASADGEWFYTDPRYTIDGLDLDVGEEVFFVPRPSIQPGKNQVAAAVLALGHSAEGEVVSMPPGQPFGFVAVEDSVGSQQHVLIRKEDSNIWPIAVGTDVGFVVGENPQGATATAAVPLGEFFERTIDTEPVSLRALLRGYDNALSRLEDRLSDAEPAFGALFEALNWAVALDERIANDWSPRGRPLGPSWRKELTDAELLGVVRLLRNRLAHQWSSAMTLEPDDGEWRWRRFDEIKPGRDDPAAEKLYRERFEGRPVIEALRAARQPLTRVVSLMEPERPAERANR